MTGENGKVVEEEENIDIPEAKSTDSFCENNLKIPLGIIGALVIFVIAWTLFFRDAPGVDIADKFTPEKRDKMMETVDKFNVLAAAGQPLPPPMPADARWTVVPTHGYIGRCHSCHPYSRGPNNPAPRAGTGRPAAVMGGNPLLMPLPPDARRSLTPPHAERGRCHSCHPYSQKATQMAAQSRALTINKVGMAVTDSMQGVFVAMVYPRSTAAKAGIIHGDIITRIDHRSVRDAITLSNRLLAARPGKRVPVTLLRDGKTLRFSLQVSDPKEFMTPYSPPAVTAAAQARSVTLRKLGMAVSDGPMGIVIAAAYKNSHAARGGLMTGDIVNAFDRKRVATVADLQKLVTLAPPEVKVPIRVVRAGGVRKFSVMVGEGEMDGVIIPVATQAQAAAWAAAGGVQQVGFGTAHSNYVICPICSLRMLNSSGAPARTIHCPRCASPMAASAR